MATKNMLLTGLIENVLYDIYPKTSGSMVFLNDTTTVAAKIAEIVEAVNARAKTSDVNTLVNNLRQEMLGSTPIEAYNTFTELAVYIAEHEEVADALTAAIGNKADASAVETVSKQITLIQNAMAGYGALAGKSKVSESDLDSALKEKVNAASDGNHSHNNKSVLDGIDSTDVTNWNAAYSGTHSHNNKSVLDGITASNISSWNSAASKGHIFVGGTTKPSTMANGDVWFKEI